MNGATLLDMSCREFSRRVILPILLAAAARAQCPNSIVAGPPSTYAGDGEPAISAWLYQPAALTLDASGNVYIADSGNNRIRKVTTDGVIHTVAGPDGLNNPQFVLAAPDGSIYIADTGNNRIRRLSPAGVLSVIAGTGHPGYSGDNGAATAAELNGPRGMAFDANRNLYFADSYNSVVRRIDTKGIVTTVMNFPSSYSGFSPQAVAIESDGTLFVGGAYEIWRNPPGGPPVLVDSSLTVDNLTLMPDGSVLIAGGSDLFHLTADGTMLSVYARAQAATDVVLASGGMYYTSSDNVVYSAATAASEPVLFAGQYYFGNALDSVLALDPIFGSIDGMAVGKDGTIWAADSADAKIRKILPNGTQRVAASEIEPSALALDYSGNLYAAAAPGVWKLAANGTLSFFAGGGQAPIPTLAAAPVAATSVDLVSIDGIAADSAGNLFVLSTAGEDTLITRITPGGQLTTIWDSSTLPAMQYLDAQGIAVDAEGNLLVPIGAAPQILEIAPDGSGTIETLGTPDVLLAVAPSPTGEVFYVSHTNRVKALNALATLYNRDISPSLTYYPVEVLAGLPASLATTTFGIVPTATAALTTDSQGNVYYADAAVNAIRKFPAGACFSVRAPQISLDSPISPMTQSGMPAITPTVGGSSLAPGELVSIFGSGLGPATGVKGQPGSNGVVATQLSGTQVFFEGVPAPILYTSDGEVDAIIPFTLYGYPQALVQVEYNGALSDTFVVSMSEAAPYVFNDSQGIQIVVNQDGSINSASHPAAPGSIITFYGSGYGLTTPPGTDGQIAAVPLPQTALPVTAAIDGNSASVIYAGDAAGMVEGVVKVNLLVPRRANEGYVELQVGTAYLNFSISVGY